MLILNNNLTEHREPNKRFVEKVQADIIRHDILQFYDFGEVILQSENVIGSTGFTRMPEMPMRLASEDVPVNVALEDDAMARIYAFFVTLEYLNLMSFSWYTLTNGVHSGGTLDYLMELEERRRETPSVNFILLSDTKFRREVFKVCSEKKELYPNYSAGLRLAMTEFRDFRQEARIEVYQPPVQVPVNPKREPEIPEVPGRGKRARQNANKAAKLAALKEQNRQLQAGATTPSTPSSSKGDAGGKASGQVQRAQACP